MSIVKMSYNLFTKYQTTILLENVVNSVVKCESLCGVAALAVFFIGLAFILFIVYITCKLTLPYLYKIICKLCNTVTKYKDIRTKANVKDIINFNTDLHK